MTIEVEMSDAEVTDQIDRAMRGAPFDLIEMSSDRRAARAGPRS